MPIDKLNAGDIQRGHLQMSQEAKASLAQGRPGVLLAKRAADELKVSQEARALAAQGKPGAALAHHVADELAISTEAREALAAHRAVLDAPAVRAELVDRLRQRIEDGTYTVDAGRLAQRLLDHLPGTEEPDV